MEIKLNLASKPYLNRQSIRLWLLLTCALLVMLLALNGWYGLENYRQIKSLESRFHELEGQVSQVQGDPAGYTPERYAAARAELELANEIVAADQFRWTHLLGRFEELMPADVSLRSIQPDFKEHSVRLVGSSRNIASMTQFVDNLLNSDDLNQAYLQRHGEVESSQSGKNDFRIDFTLVIREAF